VNSFKKRTIFQEFEPFLLFTVYFLPGYLSQSEQVNPEIFNNYLFNISFSITAIGQILLLYYIITLKKNESLSDYGVAQFRWKNIPLSLLICGGIFICIMPFSLIPLFGPEKTGQYFINPVQWKITDAAIIPLVFITCICTGYREEAFFRSYMITFLTRKNLSPLFSILCSTILFSAGHGYQGFIGLAGTAVIGLFLSVMFIKTKNLHVIAIGHGLYNFLTLMFSMTFASQ